MSSIHNGEYLTMLPVELKIAIFKELADGEAIKALASVCQSLEDVYETYEAEICRSVGRNMIITELGFSDWDFAKYCIVLAMVRNACHPLATVAYQLKDSPCSLDDLAMLQQGLSIIVTDLKDQEGDTMLCQRIFWPTLGWKMWAEVPEPTLQRYEMKTVILSHIIIKLDKQFRTGNGGSIPYATTLDDDIEIITPTGDSRRGKLFSSSLTRSDTADTSGAEILRRISTNIFLQPISGQDYLLSRTIMWALEHCEVPTRFGRLVEGLDIPTITRRSNEGD
ncbi:hypothetical protein F5Y18DRAFT_389776 [Xylariaceae sp. FL1019]|nr:hypothetical protein F5Y18DRAFT_389776 [Xylariaceae sp. FL1019]